MLSEPPVLLQRKHNRFSENPGRLSGRKCAGGSSVLTIGRTEFLEEHRET